MYILDTNIVSYSVYQTANYPLLQKNLKAKKSSELGISVITAWELIDWHFDEVKDSLTASRQRVLDAYYYFFDILTVVRRFSIVQFSSNAYDQYLGMPGHVDVNDRRIAACALAEGFVVITRNITDFADIQAVKPALQYQNWVDDDCT